jgi:hypothetical protein
MDDVIGTHTIDNRQPNAKNRMKRLLRRSNAYIVIMKETAQTP